ncbi:hypothetical protein GGR50DRAFT_227684 [Xylaria sp. CBS 124048]|nr:hypothetical protein GGR50DRAFT_227684 [Xylaria sp. CBS 124048]
MKLSTLLNLAVASGLAIAGVPAERSLASRDFELVARDKCSKPSMSMAYKKGSQFICLGKTVGWGGKSIVSLDGQTIENAAAKFASWVTAKEIGEPSATERRDNDVDQEQDVDKLFEDGQTATYGWVAPHLASRDAAYIHNMTATYDKTTGEMTEAEMVFERDAADQEGLAKRASTKVSITYFAVKGHNGTKLDSNSLKTLFQQIFLVSPPGVGSECGYAANSGTWHGAFRITVAGAPSAGNCDEERQF